MDANAIVAAIFAGEQIITGAVSAYDQVKDTLSSDDQAKVQAALSTAAATRRADFERVEAELGEAAKA